MASAEVCVNHRVLTVGATDWLPIMELKQGPAVACGAHVPVRVRVRAQIGFVRIRVFTEPFDQRLRPDETFIEAFAGPLSFSDGRLVVGDVMGETRLIKLLGEPDRRRVGCQWTKPAGMPVRSMFGLAM
ncbi:hypothetical protein OG594_23720 [Streptomyces sp. NBC_01214]|uniref:hypothetical protein n=1 Tax=Streptomyces sp. NBC_01214 TaxID=2903777 RepID=UPI002251D941|nr:hypothetical protein [Streptomyces sp. NBC_01214]MCX4804598.1 hypothetical protein [Streptomyces sp. NBC_01214]